MISDDILRSIPLKIEPVRWRLLSLPDPVPLVAEGAKVLCGWKVGAPGLNFGTAAEKLKSLFGTNTDADALTFGFDEDVESALKWLEVADCGFGEK